MPPLRAVQHQLKSLIVFCAVSLCMPSAQIAAAEITALTDTIASNKGLQIVQGDVLVQKNGFARAITVPSGNAPWVNGVVPFRIDSSLPVSSVRVIKSAVALWNELSSITLVALDGGDSHGSLLGDTNDALVFQPGPGCASWVGRRGGLQEVWIAPNCAIGSVMHEIGHALGLEHEHTRPDRDQFISINWENIDPAKRHNFSTAPAGSQALGDYDYESIMHYGPENFSINGQPTITPLFASSDVIGQRRFLSEGDLSAIARLYATDLGIVTQVYGYEEASEVALHVSNDTQQGAHGISVTVLIGDARLTTYNDDRWRCENRKQGLVDCTLPFLNGSANSVLLLSLDRTVAPEMVTSSVSSKTFDNYMPNNSHSADEEPAQAAAMAQIQDDQSVDQVVGGAVLPLTLALLLLWLHRQSCSRIYRQY